MRLIRTSQIEELSEYILSHINDNDTITRIKGGTSGSFVNGDITFIAGTNITITQSGNSITIANSYTLPTASSSTLGGIKVGTHLSITSGVLSVTPDTLFGVGTKANITSSDTTSKVWTGAVLKTMFDDYSLSTHKHTTEDITALTGYTLGTNAALIATDTLNIALGKLQAQITARGGTVTAVTASVPTGLSVSVTNPNTTPAIGITFASGYSIPTTAKQTAWDSAEANAISKSKVTAIITTSATSITETASANTTTFLNTIQNGAVADSIQFQGAGLTNITGAAGKITITTNAQTLSISDYTLTLSNGGSVDISKIKMIGRTDSTTRGTKSTLEVFNNSGTGATFPSSGGQGLRVENYISSTSQEGFYIYSNDKGDLYYKTFLGASTENEWKLFADKDWVLNQISTVNHPAVTIGTSNGLSITTGQVISLALATQTSAGAMSAADKIKLDGLDSATGNYVLLPATPTLLGGIKLFSSTVQTVAANAVTTTASRTYGSQVNSSGQLVVNVPWTDTTYTAGSGLTLTGTTFSLPITISGSGNYVSNVEQTTNGITVTKATLPVSSLVTSTSATGITNVATTNTNTYLNIVQDGASVGSSTQITGAGSITVASDTAGKLTITGTNTTYSEGTLALLTTGTDTTARIWKAKDLSDYIKGQVPQNISEEITIVAANIVSGVVTLTLTNSMYGSSALVYLNGVKIPRSLITFTNATTLKITNANLSTPIIIGDFIEIEYTKL